MLVCHEALDLNGRLISTDQLLLQEELRNKFTQMDNSLSPLLATQEVSGFRLCLPLTLHTHARSTHTHTHTLQARPVSPIHSDTFPKSRQRTTSQVDPHRMSAILFHSISGSK